MGNRQPKPPQHPNNDPVPPTTKITQLQEKIKQTYTIPLEVQVAHYTPAIFPLVPIINPQINRLCQDSWRTIVAQRQTTDTGLELNGITLFYNDFYERLHQVDENKKIESVLAAHSTGMNKIAEKGAIIIRIIQYALSIERNDEQTQFRLYTLGKAHQQRAIRPYMYSIFIQTLLYTIANQLGTQATHEIMEAWVNVFSFIMKSMLPLAIHHQTIETEIAINTKTEFSSDNVKSQVLELKEIKNESRQGSRIHSHRSVQSHRSAYIPATQPSHSNLPSLALRRLHLTQDEDNLIPEDV